MLSSVQGNSGQLRSVTPNKSTGSGPVKRVLREQRINPRDLTEVSTADLERIKQDGSALNIIAPKSRMTAVQALPESVDQSISFAPPKRGHHKKEQKFLPGKEERYTDPLLNIKKLPFQQIINKALSRSPAPVRVEAHYQLPTTYIPHQNTRRVIVHKLNGDIVEEEV